MAELSALLSRYISEAGISVQQLSLDTGIDRSTLYQYISGKRKLKQPEHLKAILKQLTLTPLEMQEFQETVAIQNMGLEAWQRLHYVSHFIKALPSVIETLSREIPLADVDFPLAPPADGLLTNQMNILEAALRIFRIPGLEEVTVLMQPNSPLMDKLMTNPLAYRSGVRMTHIVRLHKAGPSQAENLSLLEKLMSYFAIYPNYRPLCCYGEADVSRVQVGFGDIILTNRYALMISIDAECAFCVSDPAAVRLLANRLSSLEESCTEIGGSSIDGPEELSYLVEIFSHMDHSGRFELAGALCASPFLTEDIILRIINHAIPDYETVAGQFSQLRAYVYAQKATHPGVILSSREALRNFAEGGRPGGIPVSIMPAPLSPEDRIVVLRRMLDGVKAGWYDLRFIREPSAFLDPRFEIICLHDRLRIDLYCENRNFHLCFYEKTICSTFSLFFKNYSESEAVATKEEGIAYMEEAIKKLEAQI